MMMEDWHLHPSKEFREVGQATKRRQNKTHGASRRPAHFPLSFCSISTAPPFFGFRSSDFW